MGSKEIVFESAQAGLDVVGTEMFSKMTEYALTAVAAEVSRYVTEDEKPGLFSPADIAIEGKDRSGAILGLEDRAVIAWTVGTLRAKNFEAVIPLSTVSDATTGNRQGGVLTKPRETLSIQAEDTWELVFANMFEGGRSIVPILAGVMTGAIKSVFDGDNEES